MDWLKILEKHGLYLRCPHIKLFMGRLTISILFDIFKKISVGISC